MIIAVDFDGTIVDDRYPEIGKEKLFAFETLKALQQERHRLILWTCRGGKRLEEAVEFCRQRGIEFYAVNSNYPEEDFDHMPSRKIVADLYIDDRSLGGFAGWDQVWKTLKPEDQLPIIKQKSFLEKIFSF